MYNLSWIYSPPQVVDGPRRGNGVTISNNRTIRPIVDRRCLSGLIDPGRHLVRLEGVVAGAVGRRADL
jgi:hypothetical protein